MENPRQEPTQTSEIDCNRRRLTKAGLAAPAVLGTLASGKVLGADWRCTISGEVSGNMSGHTMETCNTLGTSPAGWVKAYPNWPAAFLTNNADGPRRFDQSPRGLKPGFADAFKKASGTGQPTIMDVLNGNITPKSGHKASAALAKEIVAAAMSASAAGGMGWPTYPVPTQDIVEMFNDLDATGNTYITADYGGVRWSEAEVIDYLNNLYSTT